MADFKWKRNKRGLAMILLMIILVGTLSTMFTKPVSANKDDDKNDFSFYRIASAAAAYYDDSHNGASKKFGEFSDDAISYASAGGLVGFLDEDFADGFFGATVSKLSSSSQAHSYSSYPTKAGNGSGDAERMIRWYATYGHALTELGLDTTANKSFDMKRIARGVSGAFIQVLFWLAIAVDAIFSAIIWLLKAFNPFALFKGVDVGMMQKALGGISGDSFLFKILSGFAKIVSNLYNALYDFSWSFTLPFMLVMFFASFIYMKYMMSANSTVSDPPRRKLRKWLTRAIFITFGIPLLGASYTATLDGLLFDGNRNNATTNGLPNEKKVIGTPIRQNVLKTIGHTFIDFEGWARESHLDLPPGVTIEVGLTPDNPAGQIKNTTYTDDIRKLVWAINKDTYTSFAGENGFDVETASDILSRYRSGAMYHSSDFEAERKRKSQGSTPEENKQYFETLRGLTDTDNYYGKSLFVSPQTESGSEIVPDVVTGQVLNDGKMSGETPNNVSVVFRFEGNHDSTPSLPENHSGPSGPPQENLYHTRGLSTLAMYNYLTTSFEDASFIVYSSNKATSELVVKAHRSVNVGGTGITSVLNYMNAFTLLLVSVALGVFYGFSMLFGIFRRIARMITSFPFAMMGSLRSMAHMTTYVFMMIVEVLGTIFTYFLMIELIYNMTDLISEPIRQFMKDGSVGLIKNVILPTQTIGAPMTFGTEAGAQLTMGLLNVVLLIVNLIFMYYFLKFALKVRKQVIKTIDEFMAQQIDKFFVIQDLPGSPGSGGGAVAAMNADNAREAARAATPNALQRGLQAAGAGAGAALMNAVTGGGSGGIKGVQGQKTEGAGGATNPTENTDGNDVSRGTIEGADRQTIDGDNITQQQLDTDTATDDMRRLQNNLDGEEVSSMDRPVEPTMDGAVMMNAEDARMQARIDEATGATSAMQAEANDEKAAELAEKQRQEGQEQLQNGLRNVVVGGAETVAGVASGNAALGANGAADAVDGIVQTGQANDKIKNADRDARQAVDQAQIEANRRRDVSGSQSTPSAGVAASADMIKQGMDQRRNVQASQDAAPIHAATDTVRQVSNVAGGGGGTGGTPSVPSVNGVSSAGGASGMKGVAAGAAAGAVAGGVTSRTVTVGGQPMNVTAGPALKEGQTFAPLRNVKTLGSVGGQSGASGSVPSGSSSGVRGVRSVGAQGSSSNTSGGGSIGSVGASGSLGSNISNTKKPSSAGVITTVPGLGFAGSTGAISSNPNTPLMSSPGLKGARPMSSTTVPNGGSVQNGSNRGPSGGASGVISSTPSGSSYHTRGARPVGSNPSDGSTVKVGVPDWSKAGSPSQTVGVINPPRQPQQSASGLQNGVQRGGGRGYVNGNAGSSGYTQPNVVSNNNMQENAGNVNLGNNVVNVQGLNFRDQSRMSVENMANQQNFATNAQQFASNVTKQQQQTINNVRGQSTVDYNRGQYGRSDSFRQQTVENRINTHQDTRTEQVMRQTEIRQEPSSTVLKEERPTVEPTKVLKEDDSNDDYF